MSQASVVGLSTDRQVVTLFLASIVTGAARAFSQPSMYAMMPRLIDRAELPRVSARMTSVMQSARISGPAAGGYLLHFFGMAASAGLVCLFLIAAFAFAWAIRTQIEPSNAPASESKMREFFSGAAFVFRHPILLPALSLDMISVLFGGVTGLLPVFAQDILNVGADGLGALKAASAVGAALTSLWFSRKGIREGAGRMLLGAVTGFGVCMLVFGWSRNFYLSLAVLGMSGAFDSISVIVRSTAVQLASPDALRGRISAVNSIFIGSSNEIGEFESGVAARYMGVVPSVIFGGAVCILTVFAAGIFFPALRKLDLGKLEASHHV
jgi:predicted MFS family arabinose efflux permease